MEAGGNKKQNFYKVLSQIAHNLNVEAEDQKEFFYQVKILINQKNTRKSIEVILASENWADHQFMKDIKKRVVFSHNKMQYTSPGTKDIRPDGFSNDNRGHSE